MRGLNCIFLVGGLIVSGVSCKTRRPLVEIEEGVPSVNSSLKSTEQTSDTLTTLRIVDISRPLNAKSYTRLHVVLTPTTPPANSISGIVERENYEIKGEIPIIAGRKYKLIITAYNDGKPIYSNSNCTGSKEFTAKSGKNSYTVPVCYTPGSSEAGDSPQTDEGELIPVSAKPVNN